MTKEQYMKTKIIMENCFFDEIENTDELKEKSKAIKDNILDVIDKNLLQQLDAQGRQKVLGSLAIYDPEMTVIERLEKHFGLQITDEKVLNTLQKLVVEQNKIEASIEAEYKKIRKDD